VIFENETNNYECISLARRGQERARDIVDAECCEVVSLFAFAEERKVLNQEADMISE